MTMVSAIFQEHDEDDDNKDNEIYKNTKGNNVTPVRAHQAADAISGALALYAKYAISVAGYFQAGTQ